MREIPVPEITECVAQLCIEANMELGEDMLAAFERFQKDEVSPVGRDILGQLIQNAAIAQE